MRAFVFILGFEKKKKSKRITQLEQILGSFPVLACCQIPALAIIHIHMPGAAFYWTSLIFRDGYYNVFIHAVSLCLEVFMYASNWGGVIFILSFMLSHVRHSIVWAKRIK